MTLANNAYTVTPKSLDNAQVSALVIYFKNDKGLEKLEIKDVSGQTSYFDFSNSKVNHKIDDTIFKFVIPAGVEIDDQTSN